jgi:hypothetical protein
VLYRCECCIGYCASQSYGITDTGTDCALERGEIKLGLRALIHDYINTRPVLLPVKAGMSKRQFVIADKSEGRGLEGEGKKMIE